MADRQAGTLPPFLASIPSPDDRRAVSVCPPSHPTRTKTEWHICSLAVLLLASSKIGIAAIAAAVDALRTSLRSQKGFTIREGRTKAETALAATADTAPNLSLVLRPRPVRCVARHSNAIAVLVSL